MKCRETKNKFVRAGDKNWQSNRSPAKSQNRIRRLQNLRSSTVWGTGDKSAVVQIRNRQTRVIV